MDKERNIRIGDWSETWLEIFAEPFYAAKTTRCYKQAFKRAFKNDNLLKGMPLHNLTHKYFQNFIYSLKSKYSKSSINHVRAAFSKLFQAAIEENYCENNPAAGTKLPRDAAVRVVDGLTKSEEKVLREYLPQDMYRNVMEFISYTGLRNVELRTLMWEENYDSKAGILYVRKSKTAAGLRPVPLIPEAAMIIEHQRIITEGKGFIFQKNGGGQLTETVMRRTMERVRKNTGLTNFTMHVLRHTFASRLVELKADYKAISKLMGHTSVAFTMQRYVTIETDFLKEQIMLLSGR